MVLVAQMTEPEWLAWFLRRFDAEGTHPRTCRNGHPWATFARVVQDRDRRYERCRACQREAQAKANAKSNPARTQ